MHTVLSLNEYLDYVRSAPGDEIELLLSRAIHPLTTLLVNDRGGQKL